RVVVRPSRTRQREEPFPFAEGCLRIGARIEKDVGVVECRLQANRPRSPHAIAEHVSAHVTDPDYVERQVLDVPAELAEVPLNAFPCSPGSDPFLLVVVAVRTP